MCQHPHYRAFDDKGTKFLVFLHDEQSYLRKGDTIHLVIVVHISNNQFFQEYISVGASPGLTRQLLS